MGASEFWYSLIRATLGTIQIFCIIASVVFVFKGVHNRDTFDLCLAILFAVWGDRKL